MRREQLIVNGEPYRNGLGMYQKQLCAALDHAAVQEIVDAELFAERRGKRINTVINIHPRLLDVYPADVSLWVIWLLNKLRIHCERHRFGYFAIWIRENYVGDRREHLHVMLSVPGREKAKLELALRRWLPGDEAAIKLTKPEYDTKRCDWTGRPVNKALTYLLKQMTPQARFALKGSKGLTVRRERECRKTGAPVAPVFGKRFGISRSLNAKAQRALWSPRKPDHQRHNVVAQSQPWIAAEARSS